MTEPSDDQIIADAMLLGVELRGTAHTTWYARLPSGAFTGYYGYKHSAALRALHWLGYGYRDGVLYRQD